MAKAGGASLSFFVHKRSSVVDYQEKLEYI